MKDERNERKNRETNFKTTFIIYLFQINFDGSMMRNNRNNATEIYEQTKTCNEIGFEIFSFVFIR